MNTRTSYAVIAILATVAAFSTLPAFGQQLPCPGCLEAEDQGYDVRTAAERFVMGATPVTITTDRQVYDHNDTIVVQGQVANFRVGSDASLIIFGPPPFNNVVAINQVSVNDDGSFQASFKTGGNAWKYDGTYAIKVTYGSDSATHRTYVQLTGGIVSAGVSCNPGELAASGQCIPYSISGATVSSARINVGTTSLIVNIRTTDSGEIVLDLPRAVIDSKRGTSDDQFFVLVDGEETSFDETKTSSSRSLMIEFPAGAEEIEVIGTFAIPEFGTIAALILAVAIISIIAISTKTRLNVLPKY